MIVCVVCVCVCVGGGLSTLEGHGGVKCQMISMVCSGGGGGQQLCPSLLGGYVGHAFSLLLWWHSQLCSCSVCSSCFIALLFVYALHVGKEFVWVCAAAGLSFPMHVCCYAHSM